MDLEENLAYDRSYLLEFRRVLNKKKRDKKEE